MTDNAAPPPAAAPRALVVDVEALSTLDSAYVEESWFDSFAIPSDAEQLRRVERGGLVYLLAAPVGEESGLLVVDLGPAGPLSGPARKRGAFERILRVALRHFDRSVAVPVSWQVYHEGSLISIYAQALGNGARHRLYFDQAPLGSGNIFAYGITDAPRLLSETARDEALYQEAVAGYQDAALTEESVPGPAGSLSIVLTEPLGYRIAGDGTLADWYERRLSREQVGFVDKRLDGPIRLRGAAGTGKTQSLAVKCLRDLYTDHDAGGDLRFAFLTHSSALAHEVVRGMFYALDPTERFSELRTRDGKPKLWLGTLYELIQEQLGYRDKNLVPLSLDGRDGRDLQRMLIDEAIEAALREPRIVSVRLPEAPALAARMRDAAGRGLLVDEMMNEFACALDAEKVRLGSDAADRYVRARRERWQMTLATPADRQLVVEIHHLYRQALKAAGLLGMDQMVADFGQYLVTHEWEQLRERAGFDVVFVDEYHYFTRVEAMTLHNLFKPRDGDDQRLPLVMAYDLKQSTSDAALGGGIERFRNPGVGASVEVALHRVYRSTPQIAGFLEALDESFPAIDLEGEFEIYPGRSAKDDGPVATILTYDTDTGLVDDIFRRARQRARELADGGTQVAVLCLNEQLFDVYRHASRIADKQATITTREDLRELRYAKSKCVFSMPEYVAGLQFDTVFLIHADEADLADEHVSQGARRRYVSRVYLGASRAASRLVIATSEQRGGMSPILAGALARGVIRPE